MLKKYSYLIPLLAITVGLYNIEIYRIYPFEFDTNVYFTLLESLIRTGKALMPIVAGGLPSICDINLNCSFLHPDIYGQQLFTQMPPDYTSGISLLFIPLFINKILSIFYDSKISLIYLIQIYSAGAALLYFLSANLIINSSNINLSRKIIYIAISFISQILIIQYAANGIIGELYASILISNVAIGLALTLTKTQSKFFYYICAILLGIAVESKISTIFPAGALFSILVLKNYLEKKSVINILLLIFFISLAKLTATLYYFVIFDFKINNLFLYFNSIRAVYSYNAGAGMGWNETSIIKQLSMILLNQNTKPIIYAGTICYAISLVCEVKIKNKNILLSLILIAYVLASSLIYPVIFKFPYTRILSPFFGLFPLVFLPILQYLIELPKSQYAKIGIAIISLTPLIYAAYQISPPHYPLLEQPRAQIFEPFEKSYPNFKPTETDIFLTSHFFGMPWDIYLSGALDNQGPLNANTLYGDQSILKNILNIGDIYLIQSCRWGHCSKEDQINGLIPYYKGSQASLKCRLIPAEPKAIYKLYKCDITRT